MATATRERPILFSGPMVRAILEGRKTQTRRVIVPQPTSMDDERRQLSVISDGQRKYGRPGDLLWVREAWGLGTRPHSVYGWVDGIEYRSDEDYLEDDRDELPLNVMNIDPDFFKRYEGRWLPSIHMPRWASRLTLRVIDVRGERVQGITNADARAEGVPEWNGEEPGDYRGGFRELWDSIHAKRGYSWDVNPWVWVISFERDDTRSRASAKESQQ